MAHDRYAETAFDIAWSEGLAAKDPCDPEYLRPDVKESLDAWAMTGRSTGGFLRAVLEHELFEACKRADHWNLANLPAIVSYIYNALPAGCHGSKEACEEWERRFHGVEA